MKYCSNCGAQLPDDARFCSNCGSTVAPDTTSSTMATPQQQPPSSPTPDDDQLKQGVQLCPDGKYRWIYELNMWTNPSVLFVVYKIFGWIFLGIYAFAFILRITDGGNFFDGLWDFTWPWLVFAAFFALLIYLAYALVALINGGKYMVLFEMDNEGVTHTQMKSQFKKSQAIAWLTAMVGAFAGKGTVAGAGILSATRSSMSSTFADVRSVQPYKSRNLIKVNELLFKNQVYVSKEDFDFVYDYIRARCPKAQ